MKKNLIFILILSYNVFFSQEKNNNSVNLKITYEHSLFKRLFLNDVTLIIKNNISQFKFNVDKQEKDRDNIKFKMALLKYTNNYNTDSNIFSEQRLINNKLKIASWKNESKWKITKETKIINGYKAIKATSDSYEISKDDPYYFGEVIAWFTTEIPISAGPGRYAGLPGLILEIDYEKCSSQYKLKTIDFNNKEVLIDISKGEKVEKFEILYSREN